MARTYGMCIDDKNDAAAPSCIPCPLGPWPHRTTPHAHSVNTGYVACGAVAARQRTVLLLPSNVPALHVHTTLLYHLHIQPDGGYRLHCCAHRHYIQQRRLATVHATGASAAWPGREAHKWLRAVERGNAHLFSSPTRTTSSSFDQNTPNNFDNKPPMVTLCAVQHHARLTRRQRTPVHGAQACSACATGAQWGTTTRRLSAATDPRSLGTARARHRS